MGHPKSIARPDPAQNPASRSHFTDRDNLALFTEPCDILRILRTNSGPIGNTRWKNREVDLKNHLQCSRLHLESEE